MRGADLSAALRPASPAAGRRCHTLAPPTGRDTLPLSKDFDVTRVEREKAKRRLADMPFAASDQAADADDLARAHMGETSRRRPS